MSLMRDVLERSACLDRTGMHYIMCEDRQCIILVWYIAGFVVYEAFMELSHQDKMAGIYVSM